MTPIPNSVNLFHNLTIQGLEKGEVTFIHADGRKLTNNKKEAASLVKVNRLAEEAINFLKTDIAVTSDKKRLLFEFESIAKAKYYLRDNKEALSKGKKSLIETTNILLVKLEALLDQMDDRQKALNIDLYEKVEEKSESKSDKKD